MLLIGAWRSWCWCGAAELVRPGEARLSYRVEQGNMGAEGDGKRGEQKAESMGKLVENGWVELGAVCT